MDDQSLFSPLEQVLAKGRSARLAFFRLMHITAVDRIRVRDSRVIWTPERAERIARQRLLQRASGPLPGPGRGTV